MEIAAAFEDTVNPSQRLLLLVFLQVVEHERGKYLNESVRGIAKGIRKPLLKIAARPPLVELLFVNALEQCLPALRISPTHATQVAVIIPHEMNSASVSSSRVAVSRPGSHLAEVSAGIRGFGATT